MIMYISFLEMVIDIYSMLVDKKNTFSSQKSTVVTLDINHDISVKTIV